jgi:hypothetical protein
LSRKLWFRNLRGLNYHVGLNRCQCCSGPCLRPDDTQCNGFETRRTTCMSFNTTTFDIFSNPRDICTSEFKTDFETDSCQEPGVEGSWSGTSRSVNENTQTNPLHPNFSQLSPVHVPQPYPSSTKWQLYK